MFDEVGAMAAYIRYQRQTPAAGGAAAARARKDESSAVLNELKIAALRGELISSADVKQAMVAAVTATRSRLLSLPTSLAPRLASVSDPASIESVIKGEVYSALRELSTWRFPKDELTGDAQARRNGEEAHS